MKTDAGNINKAAYLQLTKSQGLNLEVSFGGRYDTLKKVKEDYDPLNVFKHWFVQSRIGTLMHSLDVRRQRRACVIV